MSDPTADEPHEHGDQEREIRYATGPDGAAWVHLDDVVFYLRQTAAYIKSNDELDEAGRHLATNYLNAMATAFEGAKFIDDNDDNDREE